jgi:cobalt/nickel transport system permease protein
MHIPDGYLSPQTYVPAYAVMLAAWAAASAHLRRTLRQRQVPLLALGAAFSFVIMMFNVPLPGGSGHAVGAVLVAILLGPWAAVLAVSLALIVQALVFGDGGITAIGANCLTMAVVMPFTGWWTYRLLAGPAAPGSRRHLLAGAAAGYVGLNAGALATGLLFGIQPLLAHDAAGHPLYCPFGLEIAVPTMLGSHLLVFGFVEAVATGLALAFLQRTAPGTVPAEASPSLWQRAGYALLVLAVFSPLGLLVPMWLRGGTAWGEWGLDELSVPVPAGLRHLADSWHAPLPDYSAPAQTALVSQLGWYVASAFLGSALLVGAVLLLRRWLTRKEASDDRAARVDVPLGR